MKYLWVEDFDNSNFKEKLEDKWKNYYNLKDKNLEIKTNLEDAINYIQKNPNGFDIVLLDINFPISISRNSDIDIYKNYLNNIITEEFFEKNKKTGAGILLFLYLILKCRFPKDHIAFLSANIVENLGKENIPKDIKDALKYIDVDDIKNVSEDDYEDYDSRIYKLEKKYGEKLILKYSNEIEKFDINELREYVKKVKEQSESIFNDKENEVLMINDIEESINNINVKYNKAQEEFRKVGFTLSDAFEKPETDENSYSKDFKKWILKTETSYSKLRRCIIEMSNIITSNLKNNNVIISNKYINKKNLEYEILEVKYKNLLDTIKLIPFVVTNTEEEKHIYYRIVSQITHDWENSKKPIYFLPDEKIFTLCSNYKDCILKNFGYKDIKDNCKNKEDCDKVMANNKCKIDECKFSKDFKVESKHNINLCKNEFSCEYQYSIQDFTYQSVLKMVRNWLAHSKLKEKEINTGITAFIFGLGMRGIFNIENLYNKEEYIKWENKLLDLINESYNKKQKLCKRDEESIKKMIMESCFDFYNLAKDLSDFAYSPNIGGILHLIGGERSDLECHWKYILRLFAHCLFPVEIKSEFKKEEGKYEFKLEVNTDFLYNKDAIELKYFDAIYRACLI